MRQKQLEKSFQLGRLQTLKKVILGSVPPQEFKYEGSLEDISREEVSALAGRTSSVMGF